MANYPVITPVYQFYTDNPWRYNYSLDPGAGTSQGWTRDRIVFFALGQNQPGVVPVYYFHATDPYKIQLAMVNTSPGPGWVYGGIAFYAYQIQTPNTIQVYIYRTSDWRYQYSTNANLNEPGWTADGTLCYTFGAWPG
jgi:hypothetical protein